MYFEGPEKKLEIVVAPGHPSLRAKGEGYWSQLVHACQAQILSRVSSDECDAYLLSESSLFVFDDRFTMITCGRTTLINSALHFLRDHAVDSIKSLIYERKNEYFPELQQTSFAEDTERLKSVLSGSTFHFGEEGGNCLFLFHMNRPYQPPTSDTTLEILMYDLRGPAREVFSQKGQTREEIRRQTGVQSILPEFLADDYVFDPFGYSLNAVRGEDYYTIHVTPQKDSPYVSFETNVEMNDSYLPIINDVLKIFRPKVFDVVVFCPDQPVQLNVPGYTLQKSERRGLECGYGLNFSHFTGV